MKRRVWLGAAAVAVGAGAGAAWWQRRDKIPAEVAWGDALPRPDGGTFSLASFAGGPLLLNFWATWCPPCVREMPLLDRFAQAQKAAGWSVVGIAVDKAEPVREFLARQPVSYAIGVAGLDALQWVRSLGNVGGGLPFTVLLDRGGVIAQRKTGELTSAELDAWAAAIR